MATLTHWAAYFVPEQDIWCSSTSSVKFLSWLLLLGSFPAGWRLANVTPIMNDLHSSSLINYRPISIKPELSMVFSGRCRIVVDCLWNTEVCFQPPNSHHYRKGICTCCALLCVSYTLQSSFESRHEALFVQIDFRAAFDRVNHQGILFKLCCMVIIMIIIIILLLKQD